MPPFDDYEISKGRTYMYLEKAPLYPFGYGLSYTEFEISNLQLNKKQIQKGENLEVSVEITNVGKRAGTEVIQLYVHDRVGNIRMPLKQLKKFERVSLEKNEKQTVCFTLTKEDLSHWNQNNEFVLDTGSFELIVGNSSADNRLKTIFEVLEPVDK